jgi:hypothetical protein
VACIIVLLFGVGLTGIHFDASGQPQLPDPFPGLGVYRDLVSQSCGKQGVSGPRWNPKELPFIGCFGLSSGNNGEGTLAGRKVTFAVDAKGKENCKVDGVAVVRTVRRKNYCSECLVGCSQLHFFCSDEDGRDCSSSVIVISHNSDKSVFFQINQEFLDTHI